MSRPSELLDELFFMRSAPQLHRGLYDAYPFDSLDLGSARGWQASPFAAPTARAHAAPLKKETSPAETPKTSAGDTIPANASTTFTLAVGGQDTGFVNTPGDDDWFRVELVAGQSYVFTLSGDGASPLEDPYLELYNAAGQLIAIDDDAGPGLNSMLRFTATQSGAFFLNARAWEPDSGPTLTGGYRVTAALGPPQDPLDSIDFGFSTPLHIDVYFATSGESIGGNTALRSWTTEEMNAAMAALATYSAVTNLTFAQTLSSAAAEFILFIADLDDNVLGQFTVTGGGVGYGEFAPDGAGWTSAGLAPGGLGFVTLIHEFGHGLGLTHPHDNSGNSEIMQGVTSPFNSFGTYQLNQGVFTTMTYNDGWASMYSTIIAYGGQAMPMVLNAAGTFFQCIWDAGGVDTLSAGATSLAATINLNAATLLNEIGGGGFVSAHSTIRGGFTIANGVVIENAIGGGGADTITGNAVDNRLTGGAGGDIIDGSSGRDTSIYTIASTSATWVRNLNGSWTVSAGADGTDTVTNVEFLDFTDRDVFLDRAARTFAGDGASDIAWRSTSGVTAIWSMNGGTVTQAANTSWQAGNDWVVQGFGDFNGDGRDDFVWRNANTNASAIWMMNGASVQQAVNTAWQAPAEWIIRGFGDFNGDGRDDFLWRNTNGTSAIWMMDGGDVTAANTAWQAGNEWVIQDTGDFNGDGRDDILWRNSNTQAAAIWMMNGASVQQAVNTAWQAPADWVIQGTGDFDGDGRDDILWRNSNTNVTAIWMMNAGAVTAANTSWQAGAEWVIQTIGDFNGDGKDDILWRNAQNGLLSIWHMNAGTVLNAALTSQGAGAEWGII
jgi:hypothetical protein